MTRQDESQDFASAAMIRLVAAGLTRQGISVPVPSPSGARVPRSQKRDVLEAVLSAHGPVAILSIADAARHMPPEPVVQALMHARDTGELLDRWHRLERFSHGRHTVEAERLVGGSFRLTHRARDGGPPPSLAESLLVMGVLVVLSEMIGSEQITLSTEAGALLRCKGAWHAPGVSASLGSLILPAAKRPGTAPLPGAILADDPVVELRQRLAADPVRRWTLAELAAEAGLSGRTLQRRLARHSVSFTRLVTDTKLEVAASILCDARGPGLAEIGFLAGFSDQAHFSRMFNRAVGTTPGAYRADFGH